MHAQGMAVMEADWIEGTLCEPRQKPEWMVEQFLIAMEYGVKALCEFDWCGYPMGPPWYSSLTYNGVSPTAALPAYATMTHMLAGAEVVRGPPVGKGPVRGLIVRRGGEDMTCLWSAVGEVLVAAGVKGTALRVTDVVGAETEVPVKTGVAVLHLSDGPIYVPGAIDSFSEPAAITQVAAGPWVEGREYELEAAVSNPYAMAWPVRVGTVLPEGWKSSPREVAVTVPALGTRRVTLKIEPAGPGAMDMPVRIEVRAAEGTFSAVTRVKTVSAASAEGAGTALTRRLEDFEAGVGRWKTDCGQGAVITVEAAEAPVHGGRESMHLHIQHGPPAGTWASAMLVYDAAQKWSAWDGVAFWIYWKEKPKGGLQVHLAEKPGGTYWAEARPGEKAGEWHRVVLPFRDMVLGSWTGDPDNRLDLDSIGTVAFVGVGSSGTSDFWIDDVELWRKAPGG